MKHLIVVAGLLALFTMAPIAVAEEASEAAIHDVITRQLNAIKKDDASEAFAIASPDIQTIFGTSATFMSMVQRGFPQIYRSVGHRFLNIDTSTGKLKQRVLIESAHSSVVVQYDMIEIDGHWRIDGCVIEKVDEA